MKPNDKSYQIKKAQLFSRQNQYEKAIEVLVNSMLTTETVSDSITNYMEQLSVYERALKFEEYGETRRKIKSVFFRHYPPIAYYQTGARTIGYYRDIGLGDSIRVQFQELAEILPPSQLEMMSDVIDFSMQFISEDSENIDANYKKVKPMFAALGEKTTTLIYDSVIEHMKGNPEKAISLFSQSIDASTDISMISNRYFDAHMDIGKFEEGLTVVNKLLEDDPLHPVINLYKAQFLAKLNKTNEAKETLGLVIDVFRNSDQRYKYTIIAKEFANELGL